MFPNNSACIFYSQLTSDEFFVDVNKDWKDQLHGCCFSACLSRSLFRHNWQACGIWMGSNMKSLATGGAYYMIFEHIYVNYITLLIQNVCWCFWLPAWQNGLEDRKESFSCNKNTYSDLMWGGLLVRAWLILNVWCRCQFKRVKNINQ